MGGDSLLSSDDYAFETARLTVMEWHSLPSSGGTGSHLPEIVRDLLTPRVTAPLPEAWHGSYTEERATEWIRDRDSEGTTLVAISKSSDERVGLLLLHELKTAELDGPDLRLGYLIAEPQWGKGYASELVAGLVNWARGQSFGTIVAGVSPDNLASCRVLEKCGFLRIDESPDHRPEHFYAIAL